MFAVGKGAILLMFTGYIWQTVDPISYYATVGPFIGIARFLTGAGVGTGIAHIFFKPKKRRIPEDYCRGTVIAGKAGSGKTAFAILITRHFARCRWGFVWMSCKELIRKYDTATPTILDYIPEEIADRVIIYAPASEHPKWVNFFKLYSGTSMEIDRVADQTAQLFERLQTGISEQMSEIVKSGTKILLTWAQDKNATVGFWELYRFFQEDMFRQRLMTEADIDKPTRDAFAPPRRGNTNAAAQNTLQAVQRRVRELVTNESLLLAFSQCDRETEIDLLDVMLKDRMLICDTPDGDLGPGIGSFICEALVTRVQMLQSRRPTGEASRPFGVFCDEFSTYACDAMQQGIAVGREYRLAWHLICQAPDGQIGGKAREAIEQAFNQYWFTQTRQNAKVASESMGGKWPKEVFTTLTERHYKAIESVEKATMVREGKTKDLPGHDPEVTGQIIAANNTGPSRSAILRRIRSRKVEDEVDQP